MKSQNLETHLQLKTVLAESLERMSRTKSSGRCWNLHGASSLCSLQLITAECLSFFLLLAIGIEFFLDGIEYQNSGNAKESEGSVIGFSGLTHSGFFFWKLNEIFRGFLDSSSHRSSILPTNYVTVFFFFFFTFVITEGQVDNTKNTFFFFLKKKTWQVGELFCLCSENRLLASYKRLRFIFTWKHRIVKHEQSRLL